MKTETMLIDACFQYKYVRPRNTRAEMSASRAALWWVSLSMRRAPY